MRFLVILLVSIFSTGYGEINDCSKVKNGEFVMPKGNEPGTEFTTIIKRNKNVQYEESPEIGVKMKFDVKWTSPCSYTLYNPKVLAGDFPLPKPGSELYSIITNVDKDGYTVDVTSNFFEGSTTCKVYYKK